MFGSVGKIERLYLGRERMTNKLRGFGFITYATREQADKAIERFNGYKLDHLILKVESTKQGYAYT